MMPSFSRTLLSLCVVLVTIMLSSDAFCPAPTQSNSVLKQPILTLTVSSQSSAATLSSSALFSMSEAVEVSPFSTSLPLAAAGTLDPTTVLSDVLGGLLGSPAILLVPIGAALAVASLIAFFIVSYANPEVEDDEK